MNKILILTLAAAGFVLLVASFVDGPSMRSTGIEPYDAANSFRFDSSQMQQSLNAGAGSKYGDPPLHEAIRDRRLALVKKIVESGADLHHTDHDTLLPLHIAFVTHCGTSGDIFEYLLNAGADPNQICAVNKMPIAHVIASGYHVDTFCDNIHSEANTELRNSLVAQERNMLRLLYLHGANFDQANSDGLTPIEYARQHGCDRTANFIQNLISK